MQSVVVFRAYGEMNAKWFYLLLHFIALRSLSISLLDICVSTSAQVLRKTHIRKAAKNSHLAS